MSTATTYPPFRKIGLHVELPVFTSGDDLDFQTIVVRVISALANFRVLLAFPSVDIESTSHNRFAPAPVDIYAELGERLTRIEKENGPVADALKLFCHYTAGGSVCEFRVTDLVAAERALKAKLAGWGVLDRSEIAVFEFGFTEQGLIISTRRWQTVHPENTPLAFERHFPGFQQ